MMSSIELGSSSGLRAINSRSGIAARSSARTLLSEPLPARPMGVRMASTITASGMRFSLVVALAAARRISAYVLVAPQRDEVAIEPLARGDDLGLEAPAQLQHQLLIGHALGS